MFSRLLSRKFLVVLAAVIAAIQANEWTAVIAITLGYAGAQAGVDVADILTKTKDGVAKVEEVLEDFEHDLEDAEEVWADGD